MVMYCALRDLKSFYENLDVLRLNPLRQERESFLSLSFYYSVAVSSATVSPSPSLVGARA